MALENKTDHCAFFERKSFPTQPVLAERWHVASKLVIWQFYTFFSALNFFSFLLINLLIDKFVILSVKCIIMAAKPFLTGKYRWSVLPPAPLDTGQQTVPMPPLILKKIKTLWCHKCGKICSWIHETRCNSEKPVSGPKHFEFRQMLNPNQTGVCWWWWWWWEVRGGWK